MLRRPQEPELPEGWQTPTFRLLQRLVIYGSADVAEAATAAYDKAWT